MRITAFSDPGLMASLLPRVVSVVLLVFPAAMLGVVAADYHSPMLAVGAVAELLGGLLFIRYRCVWRPPASASLVLLYLMALGWLWVVTRNNPDALARIVRGLFILIGIGLIIGHDLIRTGLEPRRRANDLCRKLLHRTRWPDHLAGYADIPEVRALQEALLDDPGPAVRLFYDHRVEVRTAAFIALQSRTYWRPGEAEAVVDAIRRTSNPGVKAAGISALNAVTQTDVIADLAEYLRDRAPEVRQAALITLLAGDGGRWPLIRDAIRDTLADPQLANDGSLTGAAGRLSPMAVCDLTTWAADSEPLASRSGRTLVAHYAAVLQHDTNPELPVNISQQIIDPQTPPALRVELAALLRGMGLITPDLLDRMTDIDQPGPLRIMAAEMLLAWNPTNPDAIDVLKGLGRQSNRDTALAIARLLQKYLKMDMGIPDGTLTANSKPAAEVAKRVFQWATGKSAPPQEVAPDLGSAWVARPVTAPALPGLKQTALHKRPMVPERGSSQDFKQRRKD